jgi:long-subunit acyl-CoA synthetase (AMP-forming)
MGDPALFVQSASTLADSLHRAFFLYQDNAAFGFFGQERQLQWLTYKQVWQHSVRLAHALAQRGIARRSFVGICAPNVPMWLMSDFACCLNDYSNVGLHLSWEPAKLAIIIDQTELECLIVTQSAVDRCRQALSQSQVQRAVLVVVIDENLPLEAMLATRCDKPKAAWWRIDHTLTHCCVLCCVVLCCVVLCCVVLCCVVLCCIVLCCVVIQQCSKHLWSYE